MPVGAAGVEYVLLAVLGFGVIVAFVVRTTRGTPANNDDAATPAPSQGHTGPPPPPADELPAPVRLPGPFWWLLALAVFGILWGAAEQHDQGCYQKAAVQVASGNTSEVNCLILPWNDPVTGN